jgi:hypothetical protein
VDYGCKCVNPKIRHSKHVVQTVGQGQYITAPNGPAWTTNIYQIQLVSQILHPSHGWGRRFNPCTAHQITPMNAKTTASTPKPSRGSSKARFTRTRLGCCGERPAVAATSFEHAIAGPRERHGWRQICVGGAQLVHDFWQYRVYPLGEVLPSEQLIDLKFALPDVIAVQAHQ